MMAVAVIGSLIGGQPGPNLVDTTGNADFDPQYSEDAGGNHQQDEIPNFNVGPESLEAFHNHAGKRNLQGYKEGEDSDEEGPEPATKKVSFQEPSVEVEKPSYDDPSEIKDTVYNSEYLDLPKVDLVVPS